MRTSAQTQFSQMIDQAARFDSPGRTTITGCEMRDAVGVLTKAGIKGADAAALVTRATQGKTLSPGAKRQIEKLIGAPTRPSYLTDAIKTEVRKHFEAVRNNLPAASPGLPVGPTFESFVVEDSRCKPGMVCIWAGELWTAHVPVNKTDFNEMPSPNKPTFVVFERNASGDRTYYMVPMRDVQAR